VSWTRWVASAAAALSLGAAAEDEERIFLGSIPLERADGASMAAESLQVTLELTSDGLKTAKALAAWFPDLVVGQSSATFTVRRGHLVGGAVKPSMSESTFFVDHDAPQIQALRKSIEESVGMDPDLNQLATRVHRHISKKNLHRGLDMASTVATRREGDCTEHSVLLAALARSTGRPARMVVGVLLVEERTGRWRAYGHLWTEVYEGGAWRLADATWPPSHRVRYVPISAWANEGTNYTRPEPNDLSFASIKSMRVEPPPK
jgi:hypothetical protein